MNIIIPMAGSGKRLRPHTLTTPKPLFPIAGKTIVARLIEDLTRLWATRIQNVGFIVGDFGTEVEKSLISISQDLGLTPHIFYQREPLGTAHAVYCAQELLDDDEVVIAFADTLFSVEDLPQADVEGVIWVKEVEDPRAYGVVTVDERNYITALVEKPENFVSNLAIIGIYYLKKGNVLKSALEYIFEKKIKTKGEFQLTDALSVLLSKGLSFMPGKVQQWLDCGNKASLLEASRVILSQFGEQSHIAASATIENSLVLPPCFIGAYTSIKNSIVGPFVSIGEYGIVENSIVQDSIFRDQVWVSNAHLNHSIVGNKAAYQGQPHQINLGDYSSIN
ncbi:MAG: sugar phosphate nucleotidyltransferase [Bacteroidia bacterium]|nr:sugar phosphate nucleotidyltransferase [Bacteroidia bacterium]MDW8157253.1 sugar phosphate nucleotidyltransferase [Bacteroidia bacterium]